MQWIVRALVMVATAYLTILVILWAFQSRFIYPAPQEVAPLTPGYEEVRIETSDGLDLRAFFARADADKPTVVYFHGNGGTLENASVSNFAFEQAGFGVLLLEYRGYGGNPGEPSEQGFYRDGDAAIAWLKAQGVGSSELIIVGNSIGGGVATEMAVRHDPKALILIAPFTSLPDAVHSNFWWIPAKALVRDQYRNADKLKAMEGAPVLIQHGDADLVVPFEHGKALSRIASGADFQTFEGSGHLLSFEAQSQKARRDWVLELIGTGTP